MTAATPRFGSYTTRRDTTQGGSRKGLIESLHDPSPKHD